MLSSLSQLTSSPVAQYVYLVNGLKVCRLCISVDATNTVQVLLLYKEYLAEYHLHRTVWK